MDCPVCGDRAAGWAATTVRSHGSDQMLIETTRFGVVEIDDGRDIRFPEGLLGFPNHQRVALLQTGPGGAGPGAESEPVFYWLQSLDDAALAFVVCGPLLFVPDYQAPIRADDVAALGMADLADCQVLVIV